MERCAQESACSRFQKHLLRVPLGICLICVGVCVCVCVCVYVCALLNPAVLTVKVDLVAQVW